MTFSSPAFLFLFLPAAYAGYRWFAARGAREAALNWLLAASLIFYGWDQPWNLGVLAASLLANHLFGAAILKAKIAGREISARRLLWLGVSANILLLAAFKIQLAFPGGDAAAFNTDEKIFIPLGISFFTFQQIAFLADVRSGALAADSLRDHALFISFFPQLIMGPIVHGKELIPQFRRACFLRPDAQGQVVGLLILTIGLAKKILIAQNIAPFVDSGYEALEAGAVPTFLDAWLLAVSWQLQIYFDFSGYADMAVGLGKLFNIDLPLNFDSPLLAQSRLEFWRRWHISFGDFMRRYVFNPLARMRGMPFGQAGALAATLLIGGLWHGLSPTFLVWGLVNALVVVAAHYWSVFRRSGRWAGRDALWLQWGAIAVSFAVASAVGILFRSKDLDSAFRMLAGMTGLSGFKLPHALLAAVGGIPVVNELFGDLWFSVDNVPIFLIAVGIVFFLPNTRDFFGGLWTGLDQRPTQPGPVPGGLLFAPLRAMRFSFSPVWAAVFGALLTISILGLADNARFIYYQF